MKVTIDRVANGWVISRREDDVIDTFAFGDDESLEQPDAESLARALWEVFGHQYQSKRRAGIIVEYADCGTEQEEELEQHKHDASCCYVPTNVTRGSD